MQTGHIQPLGPGGTHPRVPRSLFGALHHSEASCFDPMETVSGAEAGREFLAPFSLPSRRGPEGIALSQISAGTHRLAACREKPS